MSGENWTPGPWHAGYGTEGVTGPNAAKFMDLHETDGRIGYIPVRGRAAGGDSREPVCAIPIDDSDAEANSYLVAAAPDLYEALKDADAVIEMIIGDDESMQASAAPTTRRVKAALAKARGEYE